jgi:hypothetical protein
MTKEEIIELGMQAGISKPVLLLGTNLKLLTAFAKLVAEKEREACAKICDETIDFWVKAGLIECAEVREVMNIAETIRLRGQE